MGARISVAFKKGDQQSVTLFNHWGGEEFLASTENYVKELKQERIGSMLPLDRLEPETVMVDYIRHLTHKMPRVERSLYLGANGNDGDNSDHGHHIISLD